MNAEDGSEKLQKKLMLKEEFLTVNPIRLNFAVVRDHGHGHGHEYVSQASLKRKQLPTSPTTKALLFEKSSTRVRTMDNFVRSFSNRVNMDDPDFRFMAASDFLNKFKNQDRSQQRDSECMIPTIQLEVSFPKHCDKEDKLDCRSIVMLTIVFKFWIFRMNMCSLLEEY